MANVTEEGGAPSSNLVAGTGTNSATFTMPASVALAVESVVATINNAAGGDATATLTIRDQSGAVIATTAQDAVIPSGDTGTATFALRLDRSGGAIRFNKLNAGSRFYLETTSYVGAPFPASMTFVSAGRMEFDTGSEFVFDGQAADDFSVDMGNSVFLHAGNTINLDADVNVNVNATGAALVKGLTGVNIQGGDLASTNNKVGFFGVTPVAQAATPTTLAQVITILRDLGFAA